MSNFSIWECIFTNDDGETLWTCHDDFDWSIIADQVGDEDLIPYDYPSLLANREEFTAAYSNAKALSDPSGAWLEDSAAVVEWGKQIAATLEKVLPYLNR